MLKPVNKEHIVFIFIHFWLLSIDIDFMINCKNILEFTYSIDDGVTKVRIRLWCLIF